MIFSSIVFIFYFLPLALLLYYGLSFSKVLKNGVLLILSLLFYAWGEPKFVFVLLLSIITNYILGLLVYKYKGNKGKIILILTCIFNLGILFIFKYLSFVVRNINDSIGGNIILPRIALPLGISFFTFQALSYVIDVYREDAEVQKNPLYLGLYIAFFSRLTAGPIVRYSTVVYELEHRKENLKLFSVGCCRFIIGLSKKILISNTMAAIADRIFELSVNNGSIPITLAWLGSIAYTLQIFFDFAGYSDMAIGLGQIFGFKFLENFNYPYVSKSIGEFWRRWHISLGTWFRDYVYIPLGGSRVKNKDKIIRNLFVVWLLTGIWHGAEWTFIIWGLLNFVAISFEKLISFEELEINKIWKHIYALFFINLGWVIFRSKNLLEAGKYISSMFGFNNNGFWSDYTIMFLRENIVFFIAGIILCTPVAKRINKFMVDKAPLYRIFELIYPIVLMSLFMICVSYLVKQTYNPFIYFNF